MKFFIKVKWLIFNFLSYIPVPFKFLSFVETLSAMLQGKGWGSSTIKHEVSACLSILKYPPNIFIDIGAHKGIYTQEVRKKVHKIECHLFEPSSTNVEILNQKFLNLDKVFINNFALSNKKTNATLFSNTPGSGIGSLTKRRLDHFKRLESRGYDWEMNFKEQVSLIRFDEYWKDKDQLIDYVKIDVEGHELDVLEGFGDLINKIKLIQFEFGGCNIDTRTYFQDFWYFFQEKDFLLYRISPRGCRQIKFYTPSEENFITSNYIALNQNIKR
jgi:FkbM family methyltransferase